ncbi:MAG: nucleotidyl transferase AbiEii/AbiGii toxin family protein [Leptospirales bacterium]|nr:nucleotidyl transferase AbiEii/AbiGii toxin family protein [Leptospirales bacterium]
MNTSKQLNDLIKNVSKKIGINTQILQKRYFMERFLDRISQSDYRNNFILKGGILISALVGMEARSTMDIDITIKNLQLNAESVKTIVTEIMTIDLEDNVRFIFRKIENIRDEAEYDCYRVSLDIAFDKVRDNIKLDITTGDAITPCEVQFGYETMLEKKKIALYSYNIETILAEKIETILSRGVLNTRMRDFYDCFILDRSYRNFIDTKNFCDALKATAKRRKAEIVLTKTTTIIEELKISAELRKLWNAYANTFQYAREIPFDEAIDAVEKYIIIFSKNRGSL